MHWGNVRVLGDRILVRPEARPEKIGLIIVPENAQHLTNFGEVIAVGMKFMKDGRARQLHVKPGDQVVFGKFSGRQHVAFGGETILELVEDEVLGVMEDRDAGPTDGSDEDC